jgi:hypothetical protein
MNRVILLVVLLAALAVQGWAQYPFYSIRQLQEVPAESLLVADNLPNFTANSVQTRWTLQTSRRMNDTVTTVAQVVIPPGVITYTQGIWTMLLYDTTKGITKWGGVVLRAASLNDTTQLKQGGFLNVNAGDIITLTVVISEFPTSRGFSTTQVAPLASKPITIIGSAPLPKPVVLRVSDLYQGIFPTGKMQFVTGEPYEGMLVELRNLTVNNKVNTARGTFSAVDADGNEISDYDYSQTFTLGHGTSSLPPYGPDTAWARIYAAMGTGVRIDTIRGVIATSSGSEGPRGYRICPIYPGDIKFNPNPAPPLLTSHRRNPVVVSIDSAATISVKATKQAVGTRPDSVFLISSVNYAAYTKAVMTYRASDTTYVGVIPKQSANTFVRYFIEVKDSLGQLVRLANSATSGIASDTASGVFFYTSLNRSLTIQDVQQTPYRNGRSPYLGAVTPLSGIITADTTRIAISPVTNGSTSSWYLQSGTQAWSGIWLSTADTTVQKQLAALRNGDSVTVTGTVQEQFDVTRLGNITGVTKVQSGVAEPAPIVKKTGDFNVANGTLSAEAYEGMLVRFTNVRVTDINPTFSDPTEYSVNDGTGNVVVQRSGKNRYSNVPGDSTLGKTVLRVGNTISALTGIVYYSFNQYKFVPRTDADFLGVVLTGVESRGVATPAAYELSQNYPNPFNPSTEIRYAIPASGLTSLMVYNLLGQEVATLVNEVQNAGSYTIRFDARSLPSGMYFARLRSGSFSSVKKMLLVK